jgi:hypothetical protein
VRSRDAVAPTPARDPDGSSVIGLGDGGLSARGTGTSL